MRENNISLQDLNLFIREEVKELNKGRYIINLNNIGKYNNLLLGNKLEAYNRNKTDNDIINGIIKYINHYYYKINDNEIYYFNNEKKIIKINHEDFIKSLKLSVNELKILFIFIDNNKDYLYNYNIINENDKPFIFYDKYEDGTIIRYFNLFHINNPFITLDDLNIIKYNSIVDNVKQLIKNYINEIPDNKKHLKQTIFISKLLKTYNDKYKNITKKDLINNIDIKKNNINGLFDVFIDKGNEQYCFKFYVKDIHF